METDKLSIVIDSTDTGIVLKLLYEAGDMVAITETIAYVGPAGADIEAALAASAAPAAQFLKHIKTLLETPALLLQKDIAKPLHIKCSGFVLS